MMHRLEAVCPDSKKSPSSPKPAYELSHHEEETPTAIRIQRWRNEVGGYEVDDALWEVVNISEMITRSQLSIRSCP